MAEPADGGREKSAVFCVDGITSSVVKHFTPDISWGTYVSWLRQRRPDLGVVHLEQPHDWVTLMIGHADAQERLLDQFVEQALGRLRARLANAVILGFSLGGLTALQATLRIAQVAPELLPNYLAFVTLGTPFRGTGRMIDMVIRRLSHDCFRRMFEVARTQAHLKTLLQFGVERRLCILVGEIERDEVVSASSALAPVHWLTGWRLPAGVRWGTFPISCGRIIRAHDGLLHDPLAIGYIDGLVDGLLPLAGPRAEYEPYRSQRV